MLQILGAVVALVCGGGVWWITYEAWASAKIDHIFYWMVGMSFLMLLAILSQDGRLGRLARLARSSFIVWFGCLLGYFALEELPNFMRSSDQTELSTIFVVCLLASASFLGVGALNARKLVGE